MSSNFLQETLEIIERYGKTPADVQWVGSIDGAHALSWDQFAALADFKYDDGYGGQEIESSLVVVGTDWWLERHEYDGSEWWEYKDLPVRKADAKPFGYDSIVPRRGKSWTDSE